MNGTRAGSFRHPSLPYVAGVSAVDQTDSGAAGYLEQRDRFIRQIFTIMAPHIDSLSTRFSFGMDKLWRKRAVAASGIPRGAAVLDICTGTGELAFRVADAVGPDGSVVGTDFCKDMLDIARAKARKACSDIAFLLADAKALPFHSGRFDAVTVSFGMRNIPDTRLALAEVHRVLRPGGVFLCLELTRPPSSVFLRLYQWYVSSFMPRVGSLVLRSSAPYLYLPQSINAFYRPDEFRSVIEQCGFNDVRITSFTMGIATLYRAVKR